MNFSSEISLDNWYSPSGFAVTGIDNGANTGQISSVPLLADRPVSNAGDINGDRIDDFIIGAPGARPDRKVNAGESYVVFGTSAGFPAGLDVNALDGSNGFTLFSVNRNSIVGGDRAGTSVSSAGDLNNDGFGDLIIGAPGADPADAFDAGKSYVLFGRSTGFSARIELGSLNGGAAGFTLNGVNVSEASGTSVNELGDINGDGIDDVIIGSRLESYVVFGRTEGFASNVDLADLDGENGFAIAAPGRAISGLGDVNGDGINDFILGSTTKDNNSNRIATVVFGKTTDFTARLEPTDLDSSNSLTISSSARNDRDGQLNIAVSSAGDINNDGIDDIIIGLPFDDQIPRRSGPGSAPAEYNGKGYVIFGSADGLPADVSLEDLNGANGFALENEGRGSTLGASVSEIGDINADGIDDLIISSPGVIGGFPVSPDNGSTGHSYVVFGRDIGFDPTVRVNSLDDSQGFVIKGVPERSRIWNN